MPKRGTLEKKQSVNAELRRLAPIAGKAQLGPMELGVDSHDLHPQHSIRWGTVLRLVSERAVMGGNKKSLLQGWSASVMVFAARE